jgi:hypothetical protein
MSNNIYFYRSVSLSSGEGRGEVAQQVYLTPSLSGFPYNLSFGLAASTIILHFRLKVSCRNWKLILTLKTKIMKTLELEKFGLKELDRSEMQINGGWVWQAFQAAAAVATAVIYVYNNWDDFESGFSEGRAAAK